MDRRKRERTLTCRRPRLGHRFRDTLRKPPRHHLRHRCSDASRCLYKRVSCEGWERWLGRIRGSGAAVAGEWARAAPSMSKTVRSRSKTAPLIITVPLAEMVATARKEAAAELELMAATPHFATAALIPAARAEAAEDQREKVEIVTVEAEGPFFRGRQQWWLFERWPRRQ